MELSELCGYPICIMQLTEVAHHYEKMGKILIRLGSELTVDAFNRVNRTIEKVKRPFNRQNQS